MGTLSAVRESRGSFREEKSLAALATPLVSEGTLHYVAPAHLEKRTSGPTREDLVVDGDELTIRKPSENLNRTLRLEQQPQIRALVESIRSTLAGDLSTLRRYYSVGLDGSTERWRLTLVPLDSRTREFLKVVRIDGIGRDIVGVDTVEANGDTSHMTIQPSSG
jgi:Outer membrane lipoprotein carrier protein LolA-like